MLFFFLDLEAEIEPDGIKVKISKGWKTHFLSGKVGFGAAVRSEPPARLRKYGFIVCIYSRRAWKKELAAEERHGKHLIVCQRSASRPPPAGPAGPAPLLNINGPSSG